MACDVYGPKFCQVQCSASAHVHAVDKIVFVYDVKIAVVGESVKLCAWAAGCRPLILALGTQAFLSINECFIPV